MDPSQSTQGRLLAGRVALVTGASRGIGRAVALAYAREGAAVCCAARSIGELAQLVEEIEGAGGRAIAVPADVTRPEQVQSMVEATVGAFGGCDVLVANAGIGGERKLVAESDPEEWRRSLEVNLYGPYLCARAMVPAMRRRGGGRMIMIGSAIRIDGKAGRSDYACSKAGLWTLVQSLSEELRSYGISVNELVPGPVRTAMTAPAQARLRADPSADASWLKEPEAVAPMALSMAAQAALEPTGQSFSLRGKA